MILLDTNVVSELMRLSPNPGVESWIADRPADSLYFSAIGEAEMRYGLAVMPMGRRRDRLNSEIDAMLREDFEGRILPFDSAAARFLCGHCRGRGRLGRPSGGTGRRSDRGNRTLPRYGGGDAQRRRFRGHGNQCNRSLGRRMNGLPVLIEHTLIALAPGV